ncbi:MAG: tetraacyldisaccharide 4'-kinase [Candidatus Latescibacterota bacterium]|nr:MAG: tetraacyldisaccharide 4'-kinase [Candidatus Latescibacterota bacterium]
MNSDTHKPKTRVVYLRGRSKRIPPGGVVSLAMLPGAMVYKIASGFVKSARIDRGGAPSECSTVISIGNIEVGGNGKTPLAIHMVNKLIAGGKRPVYISRGFKSEAERLPVVTVVVPERFGGPLTVPPGVRVLGDDAGRPVTPKIGDEGAVVMMRCPAPLLFCRDRARAIQIAREMFDPTHVILDDAFQTWAVARDIDIVLLDARAPVGNGRLLPAGTLREGPEALRRAHIIGFNFVTTPDGSDSGHDLNELSRWVSRYAGWSVPVFGIRRSVTLIDTGSRRAGGTIDGSAAAMSSIGRPERFEKMLRSLGVNLPLAIRLPDHHRFDQSDIQQVESLLQRKRIRQLIVTEKDWVKLREIGPPAVSLWVTRLELDIVGEDPVALCEKPQAVPAAFL